MQRWLAVLMVASCGSPASVPDASASQASLTIDVHAAVGMVVSVPPGIRCGACQPNQSRGVPCPPGPRTDSTCSFDFPPGTVVALSLVGEDAYTDYVCADEPARAVTSCNLVTGAPVTVGVWGEVPAR